MGRILGLSIATQACCHVSHGKVPVSYILLNQRAGSRSIVHYRDLPDTASPTSAA